MDAGGDAVRATVHPHDSVQMISAWPPRMTAFKSLVHPECCGCDWDFQGMGLVVPVDDRPNAMTIKRPGTFVARCED